MHWMEKCNREQTHDECLVPSESNTHFALKSTGQLFYLILRRMYQAAAGHRRKNKIANRNFIDALEHCKCILFRFYLLCAVLLLHIGLRYCWTNNMYERNTRMPHVWVFNVVYTFGIHPTTSKSDTLRLDFSSMFKQMHAASNHTHKTHIDQRFYTPKRCRRRIVLHIKQQPARMNT